MGGLLGLGRIVLGIHVVIQQVRLDLRVQLAVEEVPGVAEINEEHRRAHGEGAAVGDREPAGLLVLYGQAHHHVQVCRELHIGLQEALDAHAQLGAEIDTDADVNLLDDLELPVLELVVDPAQVQLEVDAEAHAEPQ